MIDNSTSISTSEIFRIYNFGVMALDIKKPPLLIVEYRGYMGGMYSSMFNEIELYIGGISFSKILKRHWKEAAYGTYGWQWVLFHELAHVYQTEQGMLQYHGLTRFWNKIPFEYDHIQDIINGDKYSIVDYWKLPWEIHASQMAAQLQASYEYET